MESAKVVLGTYENLILGYSVVRNVRKDVNPYSLELGFTDDAHRGALRCMSVSGSGILASSSTDDSVRLHNLKKRREIGGLFEHNGTVNCLAFYGKSYMFSASDDGKICMWKTKDWEMLKTLKGHKSAVLSIAIHPSGKLALSVGQDKSLLTWDLVTGKLAFQRKIKEAAQKIMFASSGEHYILVYQRSIEVCSIQDTKVVKETEVNWRINASCQVQDDIYAVGGDDRHVFLIDLITGNKLLTLDMAAPGREADFSGRVRCICAVREEAGPVVFVGTSSGTVKAFSVSIDESEESSEELMSYNANVRMTCMAVYRPTSPQNKENGSKNGTAMQEQVDENDNGQEDEEVGDDDDAIDEEDGDKEEEEGKEAEEDEEEEEEEDQPPSPKKRKKEPKEEKRQKLAKLKAQSLLLSTTTSKKQKMKSPGKKGKKKKGKVKAK